MKEVRPLDSREADLLDLTVRAFSLFAVIYLRPFGSGAEGFWPTLVLAVIVSLVVGKGLWIVGRQIKPAGSAAADQFDRRSLAIGAAAGLAALVVIAQLLSLPVAGQTVQWDGGMVRTALGLTSAVYCAGVVAIVARRPGVPRPPLASPDGLPRWAVLVDLIRSGHDLRARDWLADESSDSALEVVSMLSRSSDAHVRLWIAANAGPRLGRPALPILERLAGVDGDERVKDRALRGLIDLAPERAGEFLPTVRPRLHSTVDAEVEAAAWRLLEMHDPLLRDELASLIDEKPDAEDLRHAFEAIRLCMDDQRREIAARIDGQDRVLMPWLIKAAFRLDDDLIWNAVGRVAKSGTDHRAKRLCAMALRERYHREEADEPE